VARFSSSLLSNVAKIFFATDPERSLAGRFQRLRQPRGILCLRRSFGRADVDDSNVMFFRHGFLLQSLAQCIEFARQCGQVNRLLYSAADLIERVPIDCCRRSCRPGRA